MLMCIWILLSLCITCDLVSVLGYNAEVGNTWSICNFASILCKSYHGDEQQLEVAKM